MRAHPLLDSRVLLAVVVLLVNDHLLKRAWPGFVTGKLSDFAGMFFFPWFLHAAWVVTFGWPQSEAASRRLLWVCIAVTGSVFSAIQLLPVAAEAYVGIMLALHELGLGVLSKCAPSLAGGPPIVGHTMDPTDLLALPMLALVPGLGRGRFQEAT